MSVICRKGTFELYSAHLITGLYVLMSILRSLPFGGLAWSIALISARTLDA
ncbi:hypothetical protein IC582_005006 [Cucumis melo]